MAGLRMMDCKEDVIALIHSNLQYALTGNNSILDTVAIEKQIDNCKYRRESRTCTGF